MLEVPKYWRVRMMRYLRDVDDMERIDSAEFDAESERKEAARKMSGRR
jgi:hypothetical protein